MDACVAVRIRYTLPLVTRSTSRSPCAPVKPKKHELHYFQPYKVISSAANRSHSKAFMRWKQGDATPTLATPDASLDILFNTCPYQALVSRMWAKMGFYQPEAPSASAISCKNACPLVYQPTLHETTFSLPPPNNSRAALFAPGGRRIPGMASRMPRPGSPALACLDGCGIHSPLRRKRHP